MKRRKLVYVVCSECGKTDSPDTSIIPHNVGTATIMRCPACAGDDGRVTRCRKCCITGHGTKWE